MAGPKAVDMQRTQELNDALQPYGVSESEEELNHRYVMLLCLLMLLLCEPENDREGAVIEIVANLEVASLCTCSLLLSSRASVNSFFMC